MASGITDEPEPALAGTLNVVNTDSGETFQSFIYELFEKNGILNDLRAYLRGHIVNVIKSAETGDLPPCRKNFTQRLDLKYQALNMLIAEYLMRLEFNYSYSIFVSEIPLANMVFGFAKTLMENIDKNNADMRFKDTDVWSILNYLGVQCDSEYASKIVQMYNSDKQQPLLLCILKGMPMYKECVMDPTQNQSEDSVASSKSLDSVYIKTKKKKNTCMPECSHCYYCKKCQNETNKVKDKYKRKKKYLGQFFKNKESEDVSPAESLVKHINVMEKTLIDEMFQQLKSVYESEIEMLKVQEETKVKRSMASHAVHLEMNRNEMEESFKARELELESSIQLKKKFLWGLAHSLRDQHAHMTRAMNDVRAETERLELKEDSLKTQLLEAEHILKKRGEDMRLKITNELAILEEHLEAMKTERENITRERSELENLKDKNVVINKKRSTETEEIHSHYNLLKNELAILKSYLVSSSMQPKCVIERGTITDPGDIESQASVALNNSQGIEKGAKSDDSDERVKMNQVINDFRKKNVNFSQSNLDEIYHERSRDRSRSENSSEAGDTAAPDLELQRARDDLIQRLRDENDRLKAFGRQQPLRTCARCGPAAALRPRTAPCAPAGRDVHNMFNFNSSLSAGTLNAGWRKGAGEELSLFSNAQPRILVPGDTLPFIGVLHDRHGNARRPQPGGSRGHVRAALAGVSKRAVSPYRERHAQGSSGQGVHMNGAQFTVASCSIQPENNSSPVSRGHLQQHTSVPLSMDNRVRDKSPKSVLREAKERLKRNDSNRGGSSFPRDQSPTSVLREAKLRLRKLEIEAEAVEKSYLDFRHRQSELRLERARVSQDTPEPLAKAFDVTRSPATHQLDETNAKDIEAQFAQLQKSMRGDFDKYIREYKTKFDIGEMHFKSKPTVGERVKPIPEAYFAECAEQDDTRGNYLDTPLTEFRKLYTSERHTRHDDTDDKALTRTSYSDDENHVTKTKFKYERHEVLRQMAFDKKAELQILKRNINQLYHSPNNHSTATVGDQQVSQSYPESAEEDNNLRVEVESVSEINMIKAQTQDMLLVVRSSVNSREVAGSEEQDMYSAQMTIIVSPKRSRGPSEDCERPRRSQSPEQAARLTRNDVLDAIFHADPNNVSSVQMQLDLATEDDDAVSEDGDGEYPAECAAEGENYNDPSDGDRSPISVPAAPEDDNFWES